MSQKKAKTFSFVLENEKQASYSSDWITREDEGKLAVDVAQTDEHIIVVCPIAGAEGAAIDVHIDTDLLTIRGRRPMPLDTEDGLEYMYQECFWGKFSRTIVLPVEVKGDFAKAEYRNGILRIEIPKIQKETKIPVVIVEE